DEKRPEQARILNIIENLEREDLKDWELAEACLTLHTEFKLTSGQIAGRIRRTPTTIENYIRMLQKCMPDMVEAWKAGKVDAHGRPITQSRLLQVASLTKPEQREQWEQWTSIETAPAVSEPGKDDAKPSKRGPNRNVLSDV